MSTAQDHSGPAGLDNPVPPSVGASPIPDTGIETIRNLLRKLEEAAADLPQDGPAAKPTAALATLSASRAVADTALLEKTNEPITFKLSPVAARLDASSTFQLPYKRSFAVGTGSFAMGAAAAGVALFALGFNPFSTKPAKQQIAVLETQAAPAAVATPSAQAPQTATASPAAAQDQSDQSKPSTISVDAPAGTPVQPPVVNAEPARLTSAEAPPTEAKTLPVTRPDAFQLASLQDIVLQAGDQRQLPLMLTGEPREKDRLLFVFRNVPSWLALSKGSTIRDGLWVLPAHQADGLSVTASAAARGVADIEVALAQLDGRIVSKATLSVRAQQQPSTQFQIAAPQPPAEYNAEQVLARGQLLLDTGEIEAGRTLLRAAAEGGSVSAALKLAQTYDPAETERLGLSRNSADTSLAVRWYERAQALGSHVAAARLSALAPR